MIPFAFGALFLVSAGGSVWAGWILDALMTYAAVILSFLGGIRWGAALFHAGPAGRRTASGATFIASVVPSLAGWVALFPPEPVGLGLLVLAFAAQGAWDALAAQSGRLPDWFGRLRVAITLGAVVSLVLALIALA